MKAEDILQYKFNHAYPVQVRYNDLDLANHVNNAVFQEFFDIGRYYYFIDVLKERPSNKTHQVFIVQSNTTFIKEVFIQDELQVLTKVIRFGTSSFDMLQAIVKCSDEGLELATFCITTFVCVEKKTKKPHELITKWKEAMQNFEK